MKKSLKILAWVLGLSMIATIAGYFYMKGRLEASLPQLSGKAQLRGLLSSVSVVRDQLGVPTIQGETATDLYQAQGYLHAQERFFQMDLLRRMAAGRLSELLGDAVVAQDRAARLHGFDALAEAIWQNADWGDRDLLTAYAAGVNQGLDALGDIPFEYILLRAKPRAWTPQDSILVMYSLFLTLQQQNIDTERTLAVLHDTFPEDVFNFLAPIETSWDAPLVGPDGESLPVPPAAGFKRMLKAAVLSPLAPDHGHSDTLIDAPGSNNWAVDGKHSRHGIPILAVDMHLDLTVPNIWYRAQLVWKENDQAHKVTGITLPGLPGVLAGSNGSFAWGYTNTLADGSDLVIIEKDPNDHQRYLTPDGPRAFNIRTETLEIRGSSPQTLEVRETIWGPVIDQDYRKRDLALHWAAYEPGALDFGYLKLQTAADLETGLAIANRMGIPTLNLVAVDASGHIGWTIAGRIPARVGSKGRVPSSWANGDKGWNGWLAPDAYPRMLNPESGRIWTANARTVGGEDLEHLGFGAYENGARALQIKNRLFAAESFDERDMLAIQLDDRAIFLERWQQLMLDFLNEHTLANHPEFKPIRECVENWGHSASADSVGFWLVHTWRHWLVEAVYASLTAPCQQLDPDFDLYYIPQREAAVWSLLEKRPAELVPSGFDDWNSFLSAMTSRLLEDTSVPLSERTWGARNLVTIKHPLGDIPFLGGLLNMKTEPLPGAPDMPRYQNRDFGATQRMVVAPGKEEQAIFHMPCGQSGHPLSPFYRSGHEAWVKGQPSAFLPGEAVHRLELHP